MGQNPIVPATIRTIYCGASSACFELDNTLPYFAPEPFRVLLDGGEVKESDSNVFSLFSLRPDTEYTLRIAGETLAGELVFRTKAETCALDVRSFGGDGVHDDAAAIQTAIGCLPPGGRLVFPAGRYLSRPLMLKSHMTPEHTVWNIEKVRQGKPSSWNYIDGCMVTALLALADLTEILPEGAERARLCALFRELMEGAKRYADGETGLYWQVVDQGGREGNYRETSGSSMLAYAMLKGVAPFLLCYTEIKRLEG